MRTKLKTAAAVAVGLAALGGQATVASAATHKAKSSTKSSKKSTKKKHQANASGSTSVSDPGSTSVTDPAGGNGCHGGRGHGRHGRGGDGGPGNETALTGDTRTQAEAAAQAAYPDATVRRSSTEDPGDPSGAAYEVHMTKSDGSEIEVLEDASFKVIATQAGHHGPHGGDAGSQG